MRSFILLALIADNPAAAFLGGPDLLGSIAGAIGNIAGAVDDFIRPKNLREPATLPGSSSAKNICVLAAPTAGAVAGAVVGTIPIAGGILTSVNVGLDMLGVTDDLRCELFVMGARVGHQHVKNGMKEILHIDPNTGFWAPITDGIHHFLGVTPNETFQTVEDAFYQVAPDLASVLSGGPPVYQNTNNGYGPPPPAYAPGGNQIGFPMPGQ